MSTAPPDTPADRRPGPRWLVPTLVGGGLLLVAVLALTQPWLLWVDEVAEEELPAVAAPAPASPSPSPEAAPSASAAPSVAPAAPASPTATTPDPSPEPAGPVQLASGSFISRDHATSGTVAIVQLEDGSRVLTIDGLQTDNGPDLYVYLDDDPADAAEGGFDDGIDLGRLRGNVGDLVYELPADVDLDTVASVVIWCDRFSSAFGAADLVWN